MCDCEHCQGHNHQHNHGSQSLPLLRVFVAVLLVISAIFLFFTDWVKAFVFFAAYLIAGGDVVFRAIKNILNGEVFDENFLMSLATVGAFAIGEYPEAVMVMVLYQVGEYFQHKAVEKSKGSIAELMDIRPDYANIEVDGKLVKKSPEEININDIITVRAGEKIPLDGTVVEGHAVIDTSALTGESVPREMSVGDNAISGFINTNGVIKVKVTKTFGESTVAKILELVEHASSKKAKAENFITKFARYYTPAVVLGAVVLAIVPPIISGGQFSLWLSRALTFLVISCPCALVISVPLTFFAGIGGASRHGILIKGSCYLEALSKPEAVVFDKTGTLTYGTFSVTSICPVEGVSSEELLKWCAQAESYSNHPIAISLKNAYGKEINSNLIKDVEEVAGCGVKADVDGNVILAGNDKLMSKFNIETDKVHCGGTVVYTAKNNQYLGYIIISDEVKEDSADAIKGLKKLGVTTEMLTGDSAAAAEYTAEKLGVDRVYSQLLPSDKVRKLEELIETKEHNKSVIFVGDGINDAPVLTRADIGVAMGGLGSDAAIEAADVVIMDDKPSKIVNAVSIARKTMNIVKQNIIFAVGIKVLFLILGASGLVTMWGAVFADVGVALLAVLNALIALR